MLALVPLPAFFPAASAADIIFDSTIHHPVPFGHVWKMTDLDPAESASLAENPAGFETEGRVGAALTLAGTARFVTQISIPASSFHYASSADLTLSAYTDAGGAPGSLLWTGVQHVETPGQAGYAVFAPSILVPDTIFYTLSYDNISNPERAFGAFLAQSAPTVGLNGRMMTQDSITLVSP